VSDFYEPGVTYAIAGRGPEWQWRFLCEVVTTHPEDGARIALGWRFWNEWGPYAYGEDDWAGDYLVPVERPALGRRRTLGGDAR
jgi:hypothetical protein